ncbi:MAG: hypothetical protein JNM83_13305 [Myxococcales bacterium]|jgi:hypothetical protein|nr:hypothetical protein [Myxococcales bacterium]
MTVQERFERYYFGDSGILRIVVDIDNQLCKLELDRAALIRDTEKPFDWEVCYKPAVLVFTGVRNISFPEGYCLNYCIVDYAVAPSAHSEYFVFSLSMTGGFDNDTFMRTIEIEAKDFSLTGESVASSYPK